MSSKNSFNSGSKNAHWNKVAAIWLLIVFTISDQISSTETVLIFLYIHRGRTESPGQLGMPQKQMPLKHQDPLPK